MTMNERLKKVENMKHPFKRAMRGILVTAAASTLGVTTLALPAGAANTKFFGVKIPSQTAVGFTAGSSVLNDKGGYSVNFDPSGDMFVVHYRDGQGTVVVPAATKTLYGQSVTKNVPVEFNPGGGEVNPMSITSDPLSMVWDSKGNMFISSENSSDGSGNLWVIPKKDSKIFGQSVSANVPVQVNPGGGESNPLNGHEGYLNQMAFDANGNLFIAAYSDNSVIVIPKNSGAIFGESATKNVPLFLSIPGSSSPEGLAFDAKGNLYVVDYNVNNVMVLPAANGKIFGAAMSKNTWTELPQVPARPYAFLNWLAFDATGNLFIGDWADTAISVVAKKTGTVFGEAVTKNQLSTIGTATIQPLIATSYQFAFAPSGALVIPTDGVGETAVAVLAP